MKHRVISVLGAAAVALGAPLLAAAPASASNGPPVVGCTTGSSCMIELNYDVTYSGSTGGSNGVVITPPPCTGFPAGDAHSGSQAIISFPATRPRFPRLAVLPPHLPPPPRAAAPRRAARHLLPRPARRPRPLRPCPVRSRRSSARRNNWSTATR